MSYYPSTCLNHVVTPVERPTIPLAGQTYRQLGVQLWGRGAYEREELEGSQTKYKSLSRVEAGDIIVNKIWARNGSVAVVPSELSGCYVSGEFPTFAPQLDRLDPAWFHWYTKTPALWQQCDEKSRGTSGKNRIRPEKFLEVEIPLPPLDEQRHIVARIEELAAKVEQAQSYRQAANAQTASLYFNMSTEVFERVRAASQSVCLGELTSRVTKGESPEWQGFSYQEGGPVFVRSENVLWGRLDLTNSVHIPSAFHAKLSRSQLSRGDVLINLVGASIGRSAVYDGQVEEANVNQAVAVITPKANDLDSRYLMRFLNSGRTQQIIHGGKVETARPNISLGDLRALSIPLPTLAEQRGIVTHLDCLQAELDTLRRFQSETGAELDALMPSILSKAFRGEL